MSDAFKSVSLKAQHVLENNRNNSSMGKIL